MNKIKYLFNCTIYYQNFTLKKTSFVQENISFEPSFGLYIESAVGEKPTQKNSVECIIIFDMPNLRRIVMFKKKNMT